MKEESLISAARANDALRDRDATVFQEIYTTYSEALYLLAFRWLKDSSLAKDVVHNLFAHLWDRGGRRSSPERSAVTSTAPLPTSASTN